MKFEIIGEYKQHSFSVFHQLPRNPSQAKKFSPTNIKTSQFIKKSSQQGEEVQPGQEVSKVKKSHQPQDVPLPSRSPYIWVRKSQQGQEVPPYLKCYISDSKQLTGGEEVCLCLGLLDLAGTFWELMQHTLTTLLIYNIYFQI